MKITTKQEIKNQDVGREIERQRDGEAGHPGFLVFNLSPWEAYPAPAIFECLSSERHLPSAVAAGPFINEHNYLCKWCRAKLAPHKQTEGPEDCEQTTH